MKYPPLRADVYGVSGPSLEEAPFAAYMNVLIERWFPGYKVGSVVDSWEEQVMHLGHS